MRPNSFITCLFSIFVIVAVPTFAETTSTTTVELPTAIHFLNPAGDDVEVGPGVYQVEAAESWLKLLPVGESRSTALLLETIRGSHEEDITEPEVRTLSDPDHPELLHLAFLIPGGVGLEAVGTVTGIRPRALNFAFVGRTRKAKTFAARPKISLPGPVGQTEAPTPRPKGQAVDCGPFQKVIGTSTRHSPALAVFQNSLHLITSNMEPPLTGIKRFTPSMSIQLRDPSPLKHWIYANGQWKGKDIEGQESKTHVALAPFQGRLHMVHLGESSNDLWYSTYDGSRWTPNVKIPGQKSKVAPSLAVWNNQLHMVHLGDRSNDMWHSINKGNGWTVNVRIPGRSSDKAPALGRIPNGPYSSRLHMVYKTDANIEPQSLWHAQFDGRQWGRSAMIRGALTKAAPTLVSGYPDQLHLIHLGKSSNDLWHMLFGPNKRKNNTVEWFDEQRLISEKSKVPVGVVLFQGCYHMVSIKDDKLMHTTFSTPQVHPTVR
jgi:hypothetical protein